VLKRAEPNWIQNETKMVAGSHRTSSNW